MVFGVFFFLPNQLWQHVFSDVQEGKKEALIAATSFQIYIEKLKHGD